VHGSVGVRLKHQRYKEVVLSQGNRAMSKSFWCDWQKGVSKR